MNLEKVSIDLDKRALLEKKHEKLWRNDSDCERLVTFSRHYMVKIPWRERFNNPEKMFESEMLALAYRMELNDDSLPMVRVQFGTGIIASIFGTNIEVQDTNFPCASHQPVVESEEDIRKVEDIDPLKDGILTHLYRHIDYFKKHLPGGINLCQADLQGPWNTSHLIRGDRICTDFYDDPSLIQTMLKHVTGAMLKVVIPMKKIIGEPADVFYLQGTKVPGGSRICNCSTDMISKDFYDKYILQHDRYFLETMGGGYIHICGNHPHLIDSFNTISTLRGVEFNLNYIDLFEISGLLRKDIVIMCGGAVDPPLLTERGAQTLEKLLKGDFPKRRNILFWFNDPLKPEFANQLIQAVRRSNTYE